MRYLVTLTPLEAFLFGGDNTFGKLGDDINGSYLVKGRQFPQQSALLGIIKKEIMTQSEVLTRKVRGEWVDSNNKQKANALVGNEKFDISNNSLQDFGSIKSIEPIFLMKNDKKYIKRINLSNCIYKNGLLSAFNPKIGIYDNFICLDTNENISSEKIFKAIEQIGNKTGGLENSLFKKTAYKLLDSFKFAFYLESDYKLQNSIVTLGADRSSFKLEIKEDNSLLDYSDNDSYLTLLSDSYITIPLKGNCEFAITREISYQSLKNQKHAYKPNTFEKTEKVFLYEKGSVIINPKKELIDNLNNKNCQKIGYNTYTYKGQN